MIVIWFILLIGPLIFFHELGHFLFAKLFKVKVLRFSLGFGPAIPGLRKKPQPHIQRTIGELHRVLARFSGTVVFAEFNLALNLLWVSTRQAHGMRDEITMAIRSTIPAARLVSHI